jgi:hypothetical protein
LLGIETSVAQQAACKAEHTLGPEIIAKLLCFIEFVTKESDDGYDLSRKFKNFTQKKLRYNGGERKK